MSQLALPLHNGSDIDPTCERYRRGFQLGFVAAPRATPPEGLCRITRAGWLDGQAGCEHAGVVLRIDRKAIGTTTPGGTT